MVIRRKEYTMTLSEESGIGAYLLMLAPSDGFAATLAKAKRLTHFYSVALLLEKWFACHHSFPYFFITIFPTAFSFRSRMTGKYLISFCKKLLFIFLLILAPFRRIRGQLTFPILSFCNKHVGTAFCMKHFFIFCFRSCFRYLVPIW